MPVAIPAIAAAAFSYATGATAIGLALGFTAANAVLASAIIIGVGTFAVNTLGQALAAKPKQSNPYSSSAAVTSQVTNTAQTQQVKQAITDRKFIYGECQVSGPIVYFTTSSSNQYFHYVIVLATHQVDSIDTVWFDQNPIYVTDLDGSGNVTSGTYSGNARIKKHLGADAQTVDSDLLAECSDITSSFTLSGCAYLYIRLNKSTTLYASGAPNISAWVRGKQVFDPRTSTSYWNPNPALCTRDYLTNTRYSNLRLSTTKIDDTYVTSAANSCEEMVNTLAVPHLVSSIDTGTEKITINATVLLFQTGDRVQVTSDGTIPAGLAASTNYYVIMVSNTTIPVIQLASSYANCLARTAINITSTGSGNITITKNGEPRYTCNGLLGTATTPSDILNALKLSMAGDVLPIGGIWTIKAGVYVAPTVTLNEDNLIGPVDVQTKHTRRERFNQVQGLYTSPVNYGQTTDYPIVQDTTYITEDGGQKVLAQLDLPLTSRAQTAQRIARIQLNRHRRQRTVQLTANMSGLQVQAADTVYFSFANRSYVSKIFDIASFILAVRKVGNALAITCDMVLNETDSSVYSFDETTQEITPAPAQTSTIINPNFVDPPGVPSVVTSTYNTTQGSGVKKRAIASWAASPNQFVYNYQFEFKLTTDANYTIMPRTGDVNMALPDLAPGDYNTRVKAINTFQKESAYATGMFTVVALTGPVDMTNLSLVSLNDDITVTWDQAPDLDVKNAGFVVIRQTPDISTPSWPNARQLAKQPGITSQVHLPLLAGSYMAKFVDSAGNESLNAAILTLNSSQIFNLNLTATHTEQTSFTGTKTNMSVASSVLRLTTTGGVQATSGTYHFAAPIDAGVVVNAWVTTHLLMITYDSTNLFDSRAGNFDDATGLFDGSQISGVVAKLQISTSQDAVTYTAWQDFAAGYFTARAFDFQLVVASTNSSYQLDVQELTASVYIPDVHDTVTGATSSGALATMTYNKIYSNIPNLLPMILDAVAGDVLVVPAANITATNFKIGVLNSGSYVVRNVVVFVKGS